MLKNSEVGKGFSSALGRLLAWIPIDPNAITILSVVLAILGYAVFDSAPQTKVLSIIFFILAFFFDAVDGAIARAKNLTSREGAFLDGISDRLVEFFLILALLKFAVGEYSTLLVVILFFGTAMTAFVKAYAEHSQLMKHEEAAKMPGVLERTERSLLLLAALILFTFQRFDIFAIDLYATAILSVLTFLQRFVIVFYHDDKF